MSDLPSIPDDAVNKCLKKKNYNRPFKRHNRPFRDVDNHGKNGQSTPDKRTRLSSNTCCRICQLNVEGLSYEKREILSNLTKDNNIDILALQETHVTAENAQRLIIPGLELIAFVGHEKYGLATYVHPRLKSVTKIKEINDDNFSIAIMINELTIVNVYKPPNVNWEIKVLEPYNHPAIYVGDFNSPHSEWGYRHSLNNGDQLYEWATLNDMHLVFDPKQGGSFFSARWRRPTNPDLCFVTRGKSNNPIPTNQQYLPIFPRSQHCPIITEVGISFPNIQSAPLPRWNLQKANWYMYTKHIENFVHRIPSSIKNYNRFIGLIKSAAKRAIPRGYRKNYIPCWNSNCKNLWQQHQTAKTYEEAQDTADMLIDTLGGGKKETVA